MKNPHFNINKLALIGAILVLLGDFISLLVAYQTFCDEFEKNTEERIIYGQQRLDSQRIKSGI